VTLSSYIEATRRDVEAALPTYLPAPDACPTVLLEAMKYSLLGGGKRLRPILCLASGDAVGADRAMLMPTACAIEMIHTYSLIHDDLPAMDNDTLRRGRPTLHVVAGEGQAILAGDGLLTLAFQVISAHPRSADPAFMTRKIRAIELVAGAAGAVGMVGGQAIDLACVTPDPQGRVAPALDAVALRHMHLKKTGALIRASATAGAILGGAASPLVEAIDTAAREFGLAFQIVDDILDVEGASAELGKTAGKDAAAGKPTYPSLFGLDASKRMAADCLARAETALASVQLADSPLMGIGRWIIERRN